eukprot:TRINITY_DN2217_c0_g1_i1.p1 TRINITY_DN2217_c0_g1~~TRINITY_DN2217_c0_g1_i1.p1  ORF type:complete len:197 (+),score=36.65 TRINITY_DN2217_c0_g1_i1:488-1078(+)
MSISVLCLAMRPPIEKKTTMNSIALLMPALIALLAFNSVFVEAGNPAPVDLKHTHDSHPIIINGMAQYPYNESRIVASKDNIVTEYPWPNYFVAKEALYYDSSTVVRQGRELIDHEPEFADGFSLVGPSNYLGQHEHVGWVIRFHCYKYGLVSYATTFEFSHQHDKSIRYDPVTIYYTHECNEETVQHQHGGHDEL